MWRKSLDIDNVTTEDIKFEVRRRVDLTRISALFDLVIL